MQGLFETGTPCKLVDALAMPSSSEVRDVTQEERLAVIDQGVKESKWAVWGPALRDVG